MNWLENIAVDDMLNFTDKEIYRDFTFKNLTMKCTPLTLTGVAQFFLSMSSMDKQSLIQLPIASESKFNSLIEELAIHYEICKVLYVDAEPKIVSLQNPKNKSLSLLNGVKKNPVINDIFREGKNVNSKIDYSADKTVYRVIKNSFLRYTDRDFDNVFNTLRMSYSFKKWLNVFHP